MQHLRDDICAQGFLCPLYTSRDLSIRQTVHKLLYGFADVSGSGLGSTLTVPGAGIRCRIGVWVKDDEAQSSNFKAFENDVKKSCYVSVQCSFLLQESSNIVGCQCFSFSC
jgi:hypothetical protein